MTHYSQIRGTVLDWLGIDLTESQVSEILNDPKIQGEFKKWGLDTCTREMIGNFLAERICGMPWPCFRDSESTKEAFWNRLKENGPKLGYKVEDDELL